MCLLPSTTFEKPTYSYPPGLLAGEGLLAYMAEQAQQNQIATVLREHSRLTSVTATKYAVVESIWRFEFESDSESLNAALNSFLLKNWVKLMTNQEKEAAMLKLAYYIIEKIGFQKTEVDSVDIKNASEMSNALKEGDVRGYFNNDNDLIAINENSIKNPYNVVQTIAHETWHAYHYSPGGMNGETDYTKELKDAYDLLHGKRKELQEIKSGTRMDRIIRYPKAYKSYIEAYFSSVPEVEARSFGEHFRRYLEKLDEAL